MRNLNELVTALGAIKVEAEQGIINRMMALNKTMVIAFTRKESYGVTINTAKNGRMSVYIDDGMDNLPLYKCDISEVLEIYEYLSQD